MNEEIGRSKKAAASDMTLAATCWAASIWIFPFRLRSKTDRESRGANRGRKGGARERADDVLLFRRNKRTSEQSGLCSDVESVNTFEAPAFKSAAKTSREPSEAVRGWKGGAAE